MIKSDSLYSPDGKTVTVNVDIGAKHSDDDLRKAFAEAADGAISRRSKKTTLSTVPAIRVEV